MSLSPLTLSDFGLLEHEVVARKGDPIQAIARCMPFIPEDLVDHYSLESFRKAKELNNAKPAEVTEFLSSTFGTTLSLWLCFRKQHPAYTFEDCSVAVEREDQNHLYELLRLRDLVSCSDAMSNVDWPEHRPKKDETTLAEWNARRRRQIEDGVTNWRLIVRELIENFHEWATPQAIGQLTYYQATTMIGPKHRIGGIQKFKSEAEAQKAIG